MSQNTKGPFTVMFDTEEGWQVLGENMAIVAILGSDDIESGDPVEQDARRIAACLNACVGISTEDIEKRGLAPRFDGALQFKDTGNTVFGDVAAVKQVAELQEQRDQLLAALERFYNANQARLKLLTREVYLDTQRLPGMSDALYEMDSAQRDAVAAIFNAKNTGQTIAQLQDAGHLPKPQVYTSISKGGTYTKLGAIRGAGSLKGLAGIAYQNDKGDLFIREPECFAKRMVLMEKQEGGEA